MANRELIEFAIEHADGMIRLAVVVLLCMLSLGSSAVATTFSGHSTSEVVGGSGGLTFELRSRGHGRFRFIRVTRLRIILRSAIPAPSTARYLGIVGADSAGRSLDGKSCYRLHFASADVPPQDTEWSLALYPTDPFHGPTLLRDRWVGSNSHLSYNADGSLDIAIQRKRPKGAGNANWLPAPDGPFNLIVRASSPREQPIDVDWQVPRPRRLDP
jgi:hypothetical protein